jgi:hypothetical protein
MLHTNKKEGRLSLPGQMRWRDYFMLANMVLFIVVGGLMLYRAFSQNAPWMAYLMGSIFVFAGGYRLYLFYNVLVRK